MTAPSISPAPVAALEPGDRLDLVTEPSLRSLAAAARRDPRAGFAAVVALTAESVAAVVDVDRTPTVGFALSPPVPGVPTRYALDGPPGPGDPVVLTRPGADGTPEWSLHTAAEVAVRPAVLPRGMALWGVVVAEVEVAPDAVPAPRPGPRATAAGPAALDPGLAAVLALGAHALGLAARFRDAFLRKAATSARGWAAVKTIDDPLVVRSLGDADALLDGAAALLGARAGAALGHPGRVGAAEGAQLAAAACAAVDAARRATTGLMTLSGASALYDASPMQESYALLAALAAHPLLDRSARRRATRTALDPDVDRLLAGQGGPR
ncbi:hypothetical protein [Actinomycetospora termitidis]|uniref:Acyl-CoA dehydrogenase C-terminal domain-containing protein n=1 Tax=Actinomycetospora termitidis TaxID=3053470 RepID=A0ABT7MD61_9PSEU|nr:hypothetical protein [Actinomycetospora sp. Odt1-22]MDL5158602.1 hypothetical protein [Actinomycetospora sp. Odt1-22]